MPKHFKFVLPLCLLATVPAVHATSSPISSPEASRTDNRIYVGLNWQFGSTLGMPNLVLGARHVKVKSNDHLSNGADLSVQFTTTGGLSLDRVRLTAIGGKRNSFYGAGIGYNFKTGTPLLTGTVGAPNIRLISDYSIGNGMDGLIQLETLNKPRIVQAIKAD